MRSVNSLIGRNMAGLQMSFPIFVGEAIPPFLDGLNSPNSVKSHNERSYEPDLKLDGRPRIEIDRFNFANVCSHGPVDARASDAQEHATGKMVLAGCHSCW